VDAAYRAKSARVRQAIRGVGRSLSGEALEGMKEARRVGRTREFFQHSPGPINSELLSAHDWYAARGARQFGELRLSWETDLVTMRDLLHSVADKAADFVESLATRGPAASATAVELRSRIERPLADEPVPVERVIADLARDLEGGLIASGGPRYFGFVIGGATPASLAADWLTSAWDQNAQVYATSPAAAIVEDVVAAWLLNLLGLPPEASVGFVTGCQMANFTALCVARNAVLARAGWDIETRGLFGAVPKRCDVQAPALPRPAGNRPHVDSHSRRRPAQDPAARGSHLV
jgi:hypothetical protein